MLIAGLGLSGTPRVMMDIIENLSRDQFEISVAYKPEFPGFEDDLLDPLKKLGIEAIALRGKHLLSITGLWDLYNYVRSNSVRIIHCWDDLCIAGRILKPVTGCRIIETFGNPVTSKGTHLFYLLNKITSILMDGMIFVSEGVERSFRQSDILIFGNDTKTKVIYNVLNLRNIPEYSSETRAQIRKRFGFHKHEVILLNLGMLNPQKSQENLIAALPHVLADDQKIRLVIVGCGEREQILRDHIRALHLEDHVFLAGKRQRQEVFEILSMADIYVSSSLWEGLPIAVLEAMAFRLPVVATDVIGNREAVSNLETGLLVPPGDPGTLGKAIRTLVRDKEFRNRMGTSGRRRIEAFFHPDHFIREHELFYMSILNKN